jgi:PleD family two-component response regulator
LYEAEAFTCILKLEVKLRVRLTILAFVDHWANRKLLQSMLENQGYTSEWVENGQEAVDAAATRQFDLILMVSFRSPVVQSKPVELFCGYRIASTFVTVRQKGVDK